MSATGYKYAVFLSYTHNDNKPLYGRGEPWVSELNTLLQDRLGQLLALQGGPQCC
jgi:hypothetical protein